MKASSVLEGNKMVARTAVMILICYAKSISWVLEQTLRSLMTSSGNRMGGQTHSVGARPAMVERHHVHGAFAGETVKPHALFGCSPWLGAMARTHPGQIGSGGDHVVKKYVDSRGRKKCSGGAGLKDMQTYSEAFSVAVANVF